MMLQDRGMKKWTAMMLPEHIKKLNEWDQEANQVPPPHLTEWELAHIQQQIRIAYDDKRPISLIIYQDDKRLVLTGFIQDLQQHQSILLLKTAQGIQTIPFNSIRGADIDDCY